MKSHNLPLKIPYFKAPATLQNLPKPSQTWPISYPNLPELTQPYLIAIKAWKHITSRLKYLTLRHLQLQAYIHAHKSEERPSADALLSHVPGTHRKWRSCLCRNTHKVQHDKWTLATLDIRFCKAWRHRQTITITQPEQHRSDITKQHKWLRTWTNKKHASP